MVRRLQYPRDMSRLSCSFPSCMLWILVVLVVWPHVARSDSGPLDATSPSAGSGGWGIHNMETALRAGIGTVDYLEPQEQCADCGVTELSGTSWFLDAEVGWRYRSWTFGAFLSFFTHHDYVPPNAFQYSDVRLDVFELGPRATWHHGRLSLGAGVMPILGYQHGSAMEHVDFTTMLAPTSIAEWDPLLGAELHAAFDIARTGRVRVQVFGLVEGAIGGWNMTSARGGMGVAF